MKNTIILFLILTVFSTCKKEYNARETIKISIKNIKLNDRSVRAIEIINDSSIVYAGTMGTIGIITNSGEFNTVKKIVTDTIVPHFRSLAYKNDAIFALNIGNPALLYKLKDDKVSIVYKEIHKKVFYDAMKFFDNVNGIAIGDPTDNCLSVLITRDGGDTWNKIKCIDLPKIFEGEAAFAASNTNIAIVGRKAWIVTGGLKSRVFYTPDMGLTWKVYNTPIIQGKNSTGIYTVDFYNEKQGIICGGDYTDKFGNYANKALTFDGGKTWELVSENKAPKYISCVQYIPNTQGKEVVAVSTNGIFYSKNSGRNWEKVSDEGFYAIKFASKNTAWLSGNNKIVKMTIY
ncbi:oxidoreductase [Lutibacter sp.]|uniref:WD40/YVTN/BNR-like repeat-containing protein n=1 Tax=Lutibacter sp. TaxID=1925666 RepID=UPI0025C1868C|nr:oxidoreductase [Lutibacter sp.]MCF6167068.1 oxidoreductase [Lutibacter sp.]